MLLVVRAAKRIKVAVGRGIGDIEMVDVMLEDWGFAWAKKDS